MPPNNGFSMVIICAQTKENLLFIVTIYIFIFIYAPSINNKIFLFGAFNSCNIPIFYCWGHLASWVIFLKRTSWQTSSELGD